MSLPSEYSAKVDQFEEARWAELERKMNGESMPAWAEQGCRSVLRGQGYLHADLTAHIEDPDAHGGGNGTSRKRQAGVVGFVAAVVMGINEGIRQVIR